MASKLTPIPKCDICGVTHPDSGDRPRLREDLRTLLNSYSAENASNTPDGVLADFLLEVLEAFDNAVKARAGFYRRMDTPGGVERWYD